MTTIYQLDQELKYQLLKTNIDKLMWDVAAHRAKNKKYEEGNYNEFVTKDQLQNMQMGSVVL